MYLRRYDEFMTLDVASIFIYLCLSDISSHLYFPYRYALSDRLPPRDPLKYAIRYDRYDIISPSSLVINLYNTLPFFSSYFHYHNASQACPSQEIAGANGCTKECLPLSIYSATAFYRFDIQLQQENTLTNTKAVR